MFWVSVEKPEIDAPSNQSVFLIRKKALSSSGHTVFNSPWRPTVPPPDSVGSPHGYPSECSCHRAELRLEAYQQI
jgi:hypothetical protein